MRGVAWDGDWAVTQEFGENKEYYGRRFGLWGGHNGVDIGCPVGTTLRAPEASTVVEVSSDPLGYGLTAYLAGESGRGYRYGHTSELRVCQGDVVKRGAVVALSGNTGNSSGPHLHFGVRPAEVDYTTGTRGYVNPWPELRALEAHMARVDELEASLAARNGENTELQSQVDALRGQLGEANSTIGALSVDVIPALEAQLHELQDLRVLQGMRSLQADRMAADAKSELEDLRARVDRIREIVAA